MRIPAVFAALAAVAAAPPPASGELGTLPHGRYLCELPGDAMGPASRPVAGAWFDVINGSSYETDKGRGTYLLTGDDLVFTRGPWNGARLKRASDRSLQRTDLAGEMAKLRCVRSGPADPRPADESAAASAE